MVVKWLLGLLGAGALWQQMQAGLRAGECSGPVVKLTSGVFDLAISFKRRG